MKTILKLIAVSVIITSCRTVHKTQSEDIKTAFTSEVVKRDSIIDVKVDGLFVKTTGNNIVITEVTEYENGLPKHSIKQTVDKTKTVDSSTVGILQHSEIKEEAAKDSAVAVVTKLKNVERKVPTLRIVAGVVGFVLLSLLIGYVVKHRKNFAILPI